MPKKALVLECEIHRSNRRRAGLLVTAMIAVLISVLDCDSARSSPCSNDRECETLGGDFHYCLNARCVECVTSAGCGSGHRCVEGACKSGD
jgi:hypothetical protein